LLLLAGCATDGGAGSTTNVTAASTTTSSTSTTSTLPSTTVAPTQTTLPLDAVAVVTDSLAASSANYRFTSVVLVGERTLTTMTGVVDGSSVAAEIVTGTSEVAYVRTADGEWATGPDGEWVELEGTPPVEAPLAGLTDATDLVLESGDAEQGVFTGALGPAAGDAAGLAFTLTLEDGLVTEIRYQVDTGGELAQVITTLSDFGSAGTVSRPEGV